MGSPRRRPCTLLYLAYTHFFKHAHGEDRRQAPKSKGWLGLSPFWATVLRVELVNLAFSIDSILVAVAMSPKLWVVITGGILGIIAMRLVVGQLISLVQRLPGAGRRRVRHHRVGRRQAGVGIPPCRRLRALRDSPLVLAGLSSW
jgi:hypothetical protein